MWIVADESLSNIALDMHAEISGLECLLQAVARGEHAFAISPRLASTLTVLNLSPRARAALTASASRAAEYLGIVKQSRYKCTVVLEGNIVSRINSTEWNISLNFITQHGLPRSALMVENLRDGELLRHSATHFKALTKQRSASNLHLVHGGGADTPNVLSNEIGAKIWFILCVTDSDKLHPTGAKGATCNSCEHICRNSAWVTYHAALDSREIENHIPVELIESALNFHHLREQHLRFTELMDIVTNKEWWHYIDLKEGTTLKKCLVNFDYWQSAAQSGALSGRIDRDCLDQLRCASPAACNCTLFPAINHRLAEHVINYLQTESVHTACNRVDNSFNSASWLDMGRIISEWSASTIPQRI